MTIAELPGSCEHYNRWTPPEDVVRAALARLVDHGFVYEDVGRFFARPNIIESFHCVRDPAADQFDDMETLESLVTSCGNG